MVSEDGGIDEFLIVIRDCISARTGKFVDQVISDACRR